MVHEEIVLDLFRGYKENSIYPIDDVKEYLVKLFGIDEKEFEKCINEKRYCKVELASIMVNSLILLKKLQEFKICQTNEDVNEAYSFFLDLDGMLRTINSNIGCYEDLSEHQDYFQHTPFNDAADIKQTARFLHPSFREFYEMDLEAINCLIYILCYEYYTRINNCFFITILMAVKHSPVISEEIKVVANEMYSFFIKVLRNAHIVNVSINSFPQNSMIIPEKRTKANSNTTRLHIVYSYDNYDCYSIRFDLAHEGVPQAHFNILSPGKMKYGFLFKEEYDFLIKEHPKYSDCFIEESSKYYIKERCNSKTSKDLEKILKKREHRFAFSAQIEEKYQIEYFDILGLLLGKYSNPINDVEGVNNDSFCLDRLVGCLGLVCLSHLYGDKEKQLFFRKRFFDKCKFYKLDGGEDYLQCLNVAMIKSIGEKEII